MIRFLILSIVLFSFSLNAQQTGSFDLSIDFNESDYDFTRTLYYFVPNDYDPSIEYPLVIGFRGGPHSNAGQFRDQLTFLSDSIGAIILCPENAGHFWNEENLTKQLFQYSLDTTLAMYSINESYIYLTGLSYGGRHSVIVSMDTEAGEIPNIRGVIPFAAGSEADLQPNYDATEDFPPACICIGLNDSQNFIDVSNNLHNDIQANSGQSILNEIPGVGHTVAFSDYPNEMMECIDFIESQYITGLETLEVETLTVYPNPSNGISYIELPEDGSLEIFDSKGSLIDHTIARKGRFELTLSSGNYLIKYSTHKGREYQSQIVVQNN